MKSTPTEYEFDDQELDGSDAMLADLVFEVGEQLLAGEKLDLGRFYDHCPEKTQALGKVLPAIEALAALGLTIMNDTPGLARGSVAGSLGDFTIIREIGRGGMGVVYESQQRSLGRRVALKVLPLGAAIDRKTLQRFEVEAQAAAGLQHPHIVPIFAVGCEGGVPFYAMQLIEGESLADMIRTLRSQRIDMSEHAKLVARIGMQAAEALDHAHEAGIIHRDIKPANLLIDIREHVWVTDFGLARMQSDAGTTMTGDLIGTLRYMSPEQAIGKRIVIDYRSDIYSLGATLYELLTLEPAFAGSDRAEILRMISNEEPRPLRRVHRDIPKDLETIILKSMARDRDQRYSSAQEMADDLGHFLANETIRAVRPGIGDRVRRFARRHRVLVISSIWFTVLLSMAMTVSTVIALNAWNGERIERERAVGNARMALEVIEETFLAMSRDMRVRDPHFEMFRDEYLSKGLAFLEDFALTHAQDKGLDRVMARVYLRLGDAYRMQGPEYLTNAIRAYKQGQDRYDLLIDQAKIRSKWAINQPHEPTVGSRRTRGLDSVSFDDKESEQLLFELAQVWTGLGDCARVSGRTDQAVSHYERARVLAPWFARAGNNLAWTLTTAGDGRYRNLDRAIEIATVATSYEPRQWAFWNTLGVAQYLHEDFDAAIDAFERSRTLVLGENYANNLFLALTHWKKGDHALARLFYARFEVQLKIEPQFDPELIEFHELARELIKPEVTQTDLVPLTSTRVNL